MYLLKITSGKENLVWSVFMKYGFDVKPTSEKGFLICGKRPSFELMEKFRTYIHEVIEVKEEEAEKFLNGEEGSDGEKMRELAPVEVISGAYAGFSGITRKIKNGMAVVDLNIFGKTTVVKVPVSDIKVLPSDPWA